MATLTIRRLSRPATAPDLWRLADQGRANGVRLPSECVTGERFATSATDPGAVHSLTGFSCSCPGFVYHQRCSHHAALLERLNWLPAVAGDAPAPVPCSGCRGRGWVYVEDGDWPAEVPCRRCAADPIAIAAA